MVPRLMVVDDDDNIAQLVCRAAENLGFSTQAASGNGAFDACTAFDPDVIVVDIFMPEIDGFEVLHYLGQTHKDTSIVIVSGKDVSFRAMAERICEQEGLHIVANIAKPFSIERLHSVIAEAKKRHPIHLTPSWQDSPFSNA